MTGTAIRRFRGARGRWVAALALVLAGCTGSGDPADPRETNSDEPSPIVQPTPTGASADAEAGSEEVIGPGPGLYRIDLATGETEPILSGDLELHEPERSPDGSRLVYHSMTRSGVPQIFVLKEGTSRRLTSLPGGGMEPTWSPDGSRIAFAGAENEGGDSDIYVMDPMGGHLRVLARTPRSDRRPDWSPDGSKVVFDTYGRIWVVAVGGGEPTRHPVVILGSYRRGPAVDATWSPDGRWIAFTRLSGSTGNGLMTYAHLWLVRSDGSGEQPLEPEWEKENWAHELEPSWSPDGRSIAYATVGGNVALLDVRSLDVAYLSTPMSASDLSWGTDGLIASVGYARHPGALPSPPIWILGGERDPGFDFEWLR
ncbi:MAG TPA: hypothetical protein VFK59_06715 [Actinomycetota bacterium]|nr:hypothetical protein [Actinomycetota bacterium]